MIQTIIISVGILSLIMSLHVLWHNRKYVNDLESIDYYKNQVITLFLNLNGSMMVIFGIWSYTNLRTTGLLLLLLYMLFHKAIRTSQRRKRRLTITLSEKAKEHNESTEEE